jgi:hypothetical protein
MQQQPDVLEPLTAPAELVSLADVHAILVRDHGWPVVHPPRRHSDPLIPIAPETQVEYVRVRAEALGLAVTEGWGGRPVMTQADADRLLAAQRVADAEQRERDARDAADLAAAHAPDEVRVSELVGFFGAERLSQAIRPGGFGVPGVVTPATAAAMSAGQLPGVMSENPLAGTVAAPTRPESGTDEYGFNWTGVR